MAFRSKPSVEDLIRAQGLALAMVGVLLERDGLTPVGEFGRQLALLATVTGETAPEQGMILGAWASLVSGLDRPKEATPRPPQWKAR